MYTVYNGRVGAEECGQFTGWKSAEESPFYS